MTMILAVDIGGTKFAAGVVDGDGTVLVSDKIDTPFGAGADSEGLWGALVDVIDRVLGKADVDSVDGVGVGCGGPMLWPAGEISPLNIPGWRGFPLRARLSEKFPGVPVRVHNDAVAVVIAEHWRGSGRGHENMMGMVVSTGVGGGLILGGRTIDGQTGNAGHVGHIVVVPGGQECGCGGRGCVEAECRGPRIAAAAVRNGWRPPAGTEDHPSARDLEDSARAGDPVAIEAFARAGRLLGLGIASAVATLDVDLVMIGGGISKAGDLLFGPLELSYREHARIYYARDTVITPASLDQHAGLIGGAALILAGDRYWSAD
ncbi:MAG: ROK family protein [Mycobacteriales bacterium]